MSSRLILRLVDDVGSTAAGSTAVDPRRRARRRRRSSNAGAKPPATRCSSCIPTRSRCYRGRISDPIAALPRRPTARATGCGCTPTSTATWRATTAASSSSPPAAPRVIPVDEFAALVDRSGREPACRSCTSPAASRSCSSTSTNGFARRRGACPTTVLTNAMVWRGERLRRLEALPREGLTLQISLDSATAELHDRHRGDGQLRPSARRHPHSPSTSGFRVRVAATLGSDAGDAEHELERLFDELDLDDDQRVVRRVARQGSANGGLDGLPVVAHPRGVRHRRRRLLAPRRRDRPGHEGRRRLVPAGGHHRGRPGRVPDHRIRGDVLASTFPCA